MCRALRVWCITRIERARGDGSLFSPPERERDINYEGNDIDTALGRRRRRRASAGGGARGATLGPQKGTDWIFYGTCHLRRRSNRTRTDPPACLSRFAAAPGGRSRNRRKRVSRDFVHLGRNSRRRDIWRRARPRHGKVATLGVRRGSRVTRARARPAVSRSRARTAAPRGGRAPPRSRRANRGLEPLQS